MSDHHESESGSKTKDRSETLPTSIAELVNHYCIEIVLRPVSQEDYQCAARIFERDTGISTLRGVTHEAVIQWRDAIIRRATLTTWNTYRRQMKTLFNFATKQGWVEENLFKTVPPLTSIKRKKTVTKKVLSEVLLSLKGDSPPVKPGWFWATALKLLYFTGMRRRQLACLRWRDIDFERKIILLTVEGSKTNREWEIPIPAHCEADLLELFRASKARRTQLENCQVFWVQLFEPNYAGKEITPRQVSAAFRRMSMQTGVVVSPHRLRHTLATDLARGANPDLKSLQYLLGHSSLATTLEYVSPEMSQLREQLSKLNMDTPTEI